MRPRTAAYRVGYESPSQFKPRNFRMFGASPRRDIASVRSSGCLSGQPGQSARLLCRFSNRKRTNRYRPITGLSMTAIRRLRPARHWLQFMRAGSRLRGLPGLVISTSRRQSAEPKAITGVKPETSILSPLDFARDAGRPAFASSRSDMLGACRPCCCSST